MKCQTCKHLSIIDIVYTYKNGMIKHRDKDLCCDKINWSGIPNDREKFEKFEKIYEYCNEYEFTDNPKIKIELEYDKLFPELKL